MVHTYTPCLRRTENISKQTHTALYWSSGKSLCNRYHKKILAYGNGVHNFVANH